MTIGESIGWIGIGNLATPMVRRLVGGGVRPLLFDVRADVLEPFAGDAEICSSIADLAARADLVFSTIPNDKILTEVAIAVAGAMRPGSVFCEMSTVSPQASEAVADLVAVSPIDYLRAPVSGTVGHAVEGTLAIMTSGPAEAFHRCKPVFDHFANRSFHVGTGEEARYLKLLINNIVGSSVALLAESVAVGEKAGLDWTTMLDMIRSSTIASPLLSLKIDALKERDFEPAFPVDMMIKDIGLFSQVAAELGCATPLAERTLDLLHEHSDAGGGSEDYLALVKLLETKAGL